MSDDTQPLCGVLYVDDEEKSLKYFRLAFASKFEVFTATSAAEGLEILARESARIGIVVSDQRMPGTLGAEFLRVVRERYPRTVRILTTAFSDLQDAIAAVNLGYIYQYVVKPWDLTELGHVLQRAADYHRVLSERDALLAVKMTTLQRILCSDRVKWLLLHARSLDEGERAAFLRALAALVRALPGDFDLSAPPAGRVRASFEIAALIRSEYANASRCLDELAALSPSPDLPGALAATPAPLRPLLFALLAIPGVGPDAIRVEPDASTGGGKVRVDGAAPAADLTAPLFGLLVEPQTPPLGVALLATLVAQAPSGESLTVAVGGKEFHFSFADPASPMEVAEILAEKFAAADISRL